eukprot:1133508-Pelagomonas_calceolata.AAC.2
MKGCMHERELHPGAVIVRRSPACLHSRSKQRAREERNAVSGCSGMLGTVKHLRWGQRKLAKRAGNRSAGYQNNRSTATRMSVRLSLKPEKSVFTNTERYMEGHRERYIWRGTEKDTYGGAKRKTHMEGHRERYQGGALKGYHGEA